MSNKNKTFALLLATISSCALVTNAHAVTTAIGYAREQITNHPWVMLMIGLGLLVVGSDGLVKGGSSLAKKLGMSPLLIGLTIVAFGTSSPELLVSLNAALSGNSGLALGNAVGSNIANIGLILGIAALIAPLSTSREVLRRDVPVMILACAATVIIAANKIISQTEGIIFVLLLMGYLIYCYRDQKKVSACESPEECNKPIVVSLLMLIGGCAGLALGSDMMVDGAVQIAKGFNIPDAVIGMTVVAIGTSLPELAASIAGVAKGETDLVIGNVIGSNIFNCLAILGITASVSPIDTSALSMTQMLFMLAMAMFALPLMKSGSVISRKEGLILFVAYASYNVGLFI